MPPDLSILSSPAPLNVEDVLINIALAGVLSLLLSWHYKRFGTTFSNRSKLAWILPAICLPTVLVISVVKASLALSLGLVGALSIVRFRTPVKEPEELAYIFLAIAVGLGMGADQRLVTAAAICLILIILSIRSMFVAGSKYPNLYMNIQLATFVAKETVLKQIIELLTPHVGTVELRRFDVDGTTLEGTFYLDCKEVDSLMAVQAEIGSAFPDATVTFVEQSGVPGA